MDIVILSLLAVSGYALFGALFVKGGYLRKLFVKFGLAENSVKKNWTAFSWESCLMKMGCKADVVMFGDSLIRGSNLHEQHRQLRFVNLGCSGDTLSGMLDRVSTVELLEPKTVFFMAGINGLTDYNVPQCAGKYAQVLDALIKAVPDAKLYVHSVLPLSYTRSRKLMCKNATIRSFNQRIRELAEARGITYVDIHDAYADGGVLNSDLTPDGIHLKPEAYARWNATVAPYLEEMYTKV